MRPTPPWPTKTQPPVVRYCLVSYPAQFVLLVTINREKQMNALPYEASWEMDKLWEWFDTEDELRVGIITGGGEKAFSSGMDLKEFVTSSPTTATGFTGLTLRTGRKPVIAAINGHAYGEGFEIALNADLVLASSHSTFCLSDVQVGTIVLEGGLPRLERIFGLQRAMQLALMAYVLTAERAREWGLVMSVIDRGRERLLEESVEVAALITGMSPDSILVSRAGIRKS